MQKKCVFITGIAGFIGYHLARFLLEQGHTVVGIDNFNDYYDPQLKELRADAITKQNGQVIRADIRDGKELQQLIQSYPTTHIVHLAAQAGVRYSLTHPDLYMETNLMGFYHVLEAIKKSPIPLIFASSSSIYGNNEKIPFSEDHITDRPTSLYGATKKAGELLAYSYHHLYQIPMIGLRFFTVYGPYGRPDMAYYSFTEKILKRQPITVYGKGALKRDFTYVDDIIQGIDGALNYQTSFDIFNLGNHSPKSVLELIESIERYTGEKAIIEYKQAPETDAKITFADIEKASKAFGFMPRTSLDEGVQKFVAWYQSTNCNVTI